jgi:hypothetical protein
VKLIRFSLLGLTIKGKKGIFIRWRNLISEWEMRNEVKRGWRQIGIEHRAWRIGQRENAGELRSLEGETKRAQGSKLKAQR